MSFIDGEIGRTVVSHVKPTREPDRSVDDALIHMLRSHGEREGAALASYQRLIEQSEDEGLRYVVRLIMEDEARHHQQISEMLNDLHSFVWELDIQPRVPSMRVRHDPALREETARLLAFEKEDAKELRRLRKELRRSNGYPLLPLLVNLMLHDTAKHIDILRFIRSRAGRMPRSWLLEPRNAARLPSRPETTSTVPGGPAPDTASPSHPARSTPLNRGT